MSSNVHSRADLRASAVLLSMVLGLAACGGGGGGGDSPGGTGGTPAPAPAPAPAPIQAAAITTQPAPQSAAIGATVTFSVGATGSDLAYQWRRDGKNIAGANAAGYTLNNVQAADDGTVFTVEVRNGAGSVVSAGAALQVAVPKGLSLLAGQMGGPGNLDGQNGRLMYPGAATVGPDGLLYVADSMFWPTGPGRLRTVDPATGTLGTAGTYTVAAYPWALEFDAAGNRYEMTNSAIYKTTSAGTRTLLAGSDTWASAAVDGVGAAARFFGASDMAIDGAGHLYVADLPAGKIRKIDPAGKVVTLAGDGVGMSRDGRGDQASFLSPSRLAVDRAGNVFVIESGIGKGNLRKVAPDGTVTTLTPKFADGTSPQLRNDILISEIAVDAAGNLYVVDLREGCGIVRIAPDGIATALAGSATATGNADGKGGAARFCTAAGRHIESLVVDKAGNLIVLDSDNAAIRRVTPSGDVTTIGGRSPGAVRQDGKGPHAAFAFAHVPNPSRMGFSTGSYQLAVDAQGNVVVGEGDRIRKVNAAGETSTLMPAAGASAQARYFPGGLAHGGSAIIVIDNVISRVDANGTLHFLAGRPGTGLGQLDGKGAEATFQHPYDITVDGLGNVYLRDVEYTGDIGMPLVSQRKIAPDGTVTTFGSRNNSLAPVPWYADKEGSVWIAYTNGLLLRLRPDGVTETIRSTQPDAARLRPTAITRDAAGNLYVAERMPDTADVPEAWYAVRRIAPDGTETIVAGTRGSSGVRLGAPGSLGRVDAMAAGGDGTLYLMSENAVLKLKP